MNFYEELAAGRYGSFELKKNVGPNLMWGLLVSFLAHVLIISSPYIVSLFETEEEIPPPTRVIDISQLTKLKSLQDTHEQVKIALPKLSAPPVAAIPIAVAEDEVEADPMMMPTQMELSQALSSGSDASLEIGAGEEIIINDDTEEDVIPGSEKFIPFEVAPQSLGDNPLPTYPKNIGDVGIQGKVIARAYVDKNGDIKKYIIVLVKPEGLGFEQEVEKIIMKWKFTPAIQNHKPIGVWVDIPFVFKVE